MEERLKPPEEHQDETKVQEMKRLYGDAASKIMEMECAVQIEFDSIFNEHNPPLWPNMPLKM